MYQSASLSSHLQVNQDSFGLLKIVLNKPEKKNALDVEMMTSIIDILSKSAEDPDVKVIVITGTGDYFTSGNDLTNFLRAFGSHDEENEGRSVESLIHEGCELFKKLVEVFIECPKPLVAIVNGHAIGMGVTLLAHFDLVFASKKATFCCPFVKQGIIPEACSSVIFERLMGHSKAAELLLFGKKISAEEAFSRNLVSEVYEDDGLRNVWDKISAICSLPPETLVTTKSLLKKNLKKLLLEVNADECATLEKQFGSEEFLNTFMKYLTKSKI